MLQGNLIESIFMERNNYDSNLSKYSDKRNL